ncbi:MAG: hypothetical protein GX847_04990 [Clostridiales bacterium]|nr:hypothetical protein [Clostridiales bacterium]
MSNDNDKQNWMLNEMKTGDPAYDGKYHPEHYHSKGPSSRAILIIGGILSALGGGVGIVIGLFMVVIGIFAGHK